MPSKRIGAICFLTLVIVSVMLLAGALHVSAATSADAAAGGCQAPALPLPAPVAACCVDPDCTIPHTIVAAVPPAPVRITLDENCRVVRPARLLLDQAPRTWTARFQPFVPPSGGYPAGADCPCRNSLDSDEPPLM